MIAPYDSSDPMYLDEADVRLELARSLNVCRDCRMCVDLCEVFPSAFSLIDQLPSRDSAMMTPFQQDQLIDACHECTLCTARCPYVAGQSEEALDVWALMVRATLMRRRHGLIPWTQRFVDLIRGLGIGRNRGRKR